MSLYFNNKGGYAFDTFLSNDARKSQIINELARRMNISKAERGKKKKRKPKNKGKHRKKKHGDKVAQSRSAREITIDNQPTQQVRGYSVVNVISAKRGKYKKKIGDGQQSVGSFNLTDRKGTPWKYDKTNKLLQSDNRYKGDPKQREQLKALREQVQRIENRLIGGGGNPAQQNQAGPLAGGAGGGAGNAGGMPFAPRPVPRPAPSPPPIPKKGAVVRGKVVASSPVVRGRVINPLAKQGLTAALKRDAERKSRGSLSPKRKQSAFQEDFYRDWAFADKSRQSRSRSASPPSYFSLRGSAKGSVRSDRSAGSEGSAARIKKRQDEAMESALSATGSATSLKITTPSSPILSPADVLLSLSRAPPKKVSGESEAVSIPTEPRVVSPQDVGRSMGQSSPLAKNSSRYGSFKPRKRTGKASKPQEWYDVFNERGRVVNSLKQTNYIPSSFFTKKGEIAKKKIPQMIKYSQQNNSPEEHKTVIDFLEKYNNLVKEEDRIDREYKSMGSLGSVEEHGVPPLLPDNPLSTTEDEALVEAAEKFLSESGVMVPPPPPTNINPVGVSTGSFGSLGSGVAGVVGGGASIAAGVVGGVASGLASQLPTSSQVGGVAGRVIGAGIAGVVRGGAAAISGGYQMVSNPTEEPSVEPESPTERGKRYKEELRLQQPSQRGTKDEGGGED
mgnify:CR=1 FL=1|tara:strand:- start:11944 stop:13968 length:2025 start_codon:yes stop_codon:yes gene_type:complete